jgi:hypothetical protein
MKGSTGLIEFKWMLLALAMVDVFQWRTVEATGILGALDGVGR